MGSAGGLHASPPHPAPLPSPPQQVFIEHLLCVGHGVLGAGTGDTVLLKPPTWPAPEGPGGQGHRGAAAHWAPACLDWEGEWRVSSCLLTHPTLTSWPLSPWKRETQSAPPQAQRAAGQPVLTATEPPPQVPWFCLPSVGGCGGTEKQRV